MSWTWKLGGLVCICLLVALSQNLSVIRLALDLGLEEEWHHGQEHFKIQTDLEQAVLRDHTDEPPQETLPEPKFAWVTLLAGSLTSDMRYRTLAVAASVQKHSSFPLVVLIDKETLAKDRNGTLSSDLASLGVMVQAAGLIPWPGKMKARKARWKLAWSKLLIFNLTEWDRLVWMDNDGILTRSMDHMFTLEGSWAQWNVNPPICPTHHQMVCSAFLLLTPSTAAFTGLMDLAAEVKVQGGDQELIQEYFKRSKMPVHLLNLSEANFGDCVAKAGHRAMPGFLHAPSGFHICLDALSAMAVRHKPRGHAGVERAVRTCTGSRQGVLWVDTLCGVRTQISEDKALDAFCQPANHSLP